MRQGPLASAREGRFWITSPFPDNSGPSSAPRMSATDNSDSFRLNVASHRPALARHHPGLLHRNTCSRNRRAGIAFALGNGLLPHNRLLQHRGRKVYSSNDPVGGSGSLSFATIPMGIHASLYLPRARAVSAARPLQPSSNRLHNSLLDWGTFPFRVSEHLTFFGGPTTIRRKPRSKVHFTVIQHDRTSPVWPVGFTFSTYFS